MFTFQFKNPKNLTLATIINYFVWVFILLTAIIFSWLFLFVYSNLYTAITQQIAVSNLKSELIITKVHKPQFDQIIKKYVEKQHPSESINFAGLVNPFKPEAAPPETKNK